MNKKVFGRKLSRSRPAREALFTSLTRSLILNGKIETTKAKAKAVIGSAEKMVTLAKKGGVSAKRNVLADLDNSKEATEKLFSAIAKAFTSRNSGFIRIISLPRRHGDNAEMVRLEWTEKIVVEEKKKEAKKEAKKEEAKPAKKIVKKEVKTKK
jgi:large subunit ribosomal protein L17